MYILCLFLLVPSILKNAAYAAFTSTPGTLTGCTSDSVQFNWVYDNPSDANIASWDYLGTNILSFQQSSGNVLVGSAYTGRATHISNGAFTLGNVTSGDTGQYQCTVTYISNPTARDTATLTVYEKVTQEFKPACIENSKVICGSGIDSSGITFGWEVDGESIPDTSQTIEGQNGAKNYTCTISGDRVTNCLDTGVKVSSFVVCEFDTSDTSETRGIATLAVGVVMVVCDIVVIAFLLFYFVKKEVLEKLTFLKERLAWIVILVIMIVLTIVEIGLAVGSAVNESCTSACLWLIGLVLALVCTVPVSLCVIYVILKVSSSAVPGNQISPLNKLLCRNAETSDKRGSADGREGNNAPPNEERAKDHVSASDVRVNSPKSHDSPSSPQKPSRPLPGPPPMQTLDHPVMKELPKKDKLPSIEVKGQENTEENTGQKNTEDKKKKKKKKKRKTQTNDGDEDVKKETEGDE